MVQADSFNRSRIGTVIVVPLTTNLVLEEAPGNVGLGTAETGLSKDSVAVVSQVTALDRNRLLKKSGSLGPAKIREIEKGLRLVLGLD